MRIWVIAAVVFALAGVPAGAHHSISSAYDANREVNVRGIVREFQFVNPHPFVMIEVAEGIGSAEWLLEMDNRRELAQIGISSHPLKPGDRVIVTGHPSRARGQSLYVRRLDRPADGFRYEQIGNRPRLGSTR
jgi:hypothetical protein